MPGEFTGRTLPLEEPTSTLGPIPSTRRAAEGDGTTDATSADELPSRDRSVPGTTPLEAVSYSEPSREHEDAFVTDH